MAQAIITEKRPVTTKFVESKELVRTSISSKKYPAVVLVNETIPFYLKFTNIGIPGYGPNNVPGIGLQVIGYSNYIL